MKEQVYLVGPFFGELQWEYTYFTPYVINLKKKEPDKKIIVFTRASSFDLYGIFADILVPLKVINDQPVLRNKFTLNGLREDEFDLLKKVFVKKYKYRFRIIDKIYPEIRNFSYKVKWQFPKSEMDYGFRPRIKNKEIASKFMSGYNVFVDIEDDNSLKLQSYNVKYKNDYIRQISEFMNSGSSILGCEIEAIKAVDFIIGNLSSNISRLAILLRKPLITLNEKLTDDEIGLINPFKTPVISCTNIEEGVEIYENHIRSTWSGPWK